MAEASNSNLDPNKAVPTDGTPRGPLLPENTTKSSTIPLLPISGSANCGPGGLASASGYTSDLVNSNSNNNENLNNVILNNVQKTGNTTAISSTFLRDPSSLTSYRTNRMSHEASEQARLAQPSWMKIELSPTANARRYRVP